MSYQFSPASIKALKRAGWTPQRKAKLDPYLAKMKELGLPVFPSVLDFLQEFGWLKVQTHRGYLEFDPLNALAYTWPEEILNDYTPRVGSELAIFGHWHDIELLMDHSGAIYGGSGCWLAWLSASGPALIDDLCAKNRHEAREYPELPQ